MIYLTSFSNRALAAVFCTALLSGCAGSLGSRAGDFPSGAVAVLPFENSSGRTAPTGELKKVMEEQLRARGVALVGEEALRAFMDRNRLRYTGGIDDVTADALRKETGASAILVTTVDMHAEASSPATGLFSRLLTADRREVAWMDEAAVRGDGAPGILGIGIVQDPAVVAGRAIDRVVSSLAGHLSGAAPAAPPASHPPRVFHRARDLDVVEEGARIAVIPFLNRSDRKHAGELVALQMVRSLAQEKHWKVVEPGEIRRKLLQFRITLEEGVSLPTYDVIFDGVDADYIVTGQVTDYREAGPDGSPGVEFSVTVFRRQERRVVWSSHSSGNGDDGVWFFDAGKVSTAHELAARMAASVVRRLSPGGS